MSIPQYKEPAWLLAKTDQKLADMRDNLTADRLAGFKAVLIPLFDPAPGVDDTGGGRWDRTCDNCGKYCPDGTPYFVGQTKREMHGKSVFLTFGACSECIGISA
jgi:hypothetical protein